MKNDIKNTKKDKFFYCMEFEEDNCFYKLIQARFKVQEKNVVRAAFLALSALFFLSFAIYVLLTNAQLFSLTLPYSNNQQFLYFNLPHRHPQPIYILYKLDNFYQNSRIYFQSMNNAQLSGQTISQSNAVRTCGKNASHNADLIKLGYSTSWGGEPLDPQAVASPCGMVAFTYFNDSYELFDQNSNYINIESQDISWPGDKGTKFKRGQNSSQLQWIDPENQHFINWMKIAGLPDFMKLWGVIDAGLQKGTYRIQIENNYNASVFMSKKSLILTSASSLGARNDYLGWILLGTGLSNLVALALSFYATKKCTKQ